MFKNIHKLCILAVAVSGAVNAAGVPVSAIEAEFTSVNPTKDFVAKFDPQAHTQITPRVSGYIVDQLVADGAMVTKGDVLFKIDDTTYRHNQQLAKANVTQATAAHKSAQLHFDRVVKLQGPGGSTQSDLEMAQAQLDSAKAALTAAEINLEKAEYDLKSTEIVAPYSGQIGKARFSQGDLVAPATGALIDIVQLTPMNVTFTMDYNSYKKFGLESEENQSIRLRDTQTPTAVNYVANKVNPTAGTIQISASFDNSELGYKPNKVTHVTVEHNQAEDGVWLPESALIRDLTVQYVYVINDENKAERRDIEVVLRNNGRVFVSAGVNDGEQVITDGLIRVRPDVPVQVQ
ncbi:efflux RND transporter periplasmic adaptor subunit [Photobacterium rosenbergii]|uniref:Efflux RND transporter periplasmic adaptor subunit n=1 Tax=Photobacterium rosenbergii TaxID=294936 RepID=A0ABU3ZHN8_9GAMM|nr:efflux RND transporter periplasmic adaptor subunit [Photobacterium rosenbergii]MDV5169649.1 efflux RND transporter periplasmic adaptor subunit [Photobacterium rosenbergii]